jgi:transposase
MINQSTIMIKIVPATKSYWQNKLKKQLTLNETVEVLVHDLPEKSNVNINCMCDNCNKIYMQRKSRNTDICGKCASSLKMKNNNHGKNNRKHDIPDKELLRNLIVNGKVFVANYFNVSIPLVTTWLKYHEIEIPSYYGSLSKVPEKNDLYELHFNKGMTIKDIARHYKVGTVTVKKWMEQHELEQQFYRKPKVAIPSKEILHNLHFNEKRTLVNISEIFDVSDVLVKTWFKFYGMNDINYYNGESFQTETNIRNILNSLGCNFSKSRSHIYPKELDMIDDEYKLAIEYCGLYWHSDDKIDKNYHLKKLEDCNKNGIQLITIFEDEWLLKPDIVLSIIKSKIGKSNKIFARKCGVCSIGTKEARLFLKNNHIQNAPVDISHSFGLFHEGILCGVMSFGRHHRGKDVLVLNRLCFLKDHVVIGGAEKLFKFSRTVITERIISWSDRRWSEGKIYEKLGFKKINTLPPDYSYVKRQQRFSKQSMKKSLVGCPSHIKEIDFNKSNGYNVIWDCGKDVWEFNS